MPTKIVTATGLERISLCVVYQGHCLCYDSAYFLVILHMRNVKNKKKGFEGLSKCTQIIEYSSL